MPLELNVITFKHTVGVRNRSGQLALHCPKLVDRFARVYTA